MPLLLCPNCDTGTKSLSRSGVELDMCPKCRGVWLDRGELEKIIDAGRRGPAGKPDKKRGKVFDIFDIFD